MKTPSKLITVAQIAKRLGVNRQRVHFLVKRYGIEFTRVGSICALTERDLARLVRLQNSNPMALRHQKIRDRAKG